MPLQQIQANMEIRKTICKGAPFYILGPLLIDIAPGYDHFTAAIDGVIAWDHEMAMARRNLDWENMFDVAIDSDKARQYRKDSTPEREDTCTMCGKMCAIRNMNKILNGETVDIMEES